MSVFKATENLPGTSLFAMKAATTPLWLYFPVKKGNPIMRSSCPSPSTSPASRLYPRLQYGLYENV